MLIKKKLVTEEDRAKALAKAREKQRRRITKYEAASREKRNLFLLLCFCGSSSITFDVSDFFQRKGRRWYDTGIRGIGYDGAGRDRSLAWRTRDEREREELYNM